MAWSDGAVECERTAAAAVTVGSERMAAAAATAVCAREDDNAGCTTANRDLSDWKDGGDSFKPKLNEDSLIVNHWSKDGYLEGD